MSVTEPAGFEAAGMACGIKESGAPDLALVATADRRSAAAAGVFTTNRVAAAPVQISRKHLEDDRAAAIVLNSGNANAATGEPGRTDALQMCEQVGDALTISPADVLVCSTGLIGIPLAMTPITSGIPLLAEELRGDAEGASAAAGAILTTDTVPKTSTAQFPLDRGATATVGSIAKGAAMLQPAMATMLAVLTTDAAIEPQALHVALEGAVDVSFNSMSVDGCTSTNDTVLVLANGVVGNRPIGLGGPAFHALVAALREVCVDLAEQMAGDAEGATKFARIVVRGARSLDDARRAARSVANSQLVQCSLYGCDPYWGRVLSELGASGASMDAEQVDIAYNGIIVCRDGIAAKHDAVALDEEMGGREIEIVCDLHRGGNEAAILTTDLTHAYIDENMGTS